MPTHKERMVLVGRKTLCAGCINGGEPVKYGDILDLSGEALEYAKSKTYTDGSNNEQPVFMSEDSAPARRAIAIATGQPIPVTNPIPRTRRRRAA